MSNSNVEYQKTQLKKKIAELRKQRTTIFVDSERQILEDHIKELEQQIRLLKEQVDFLTRKLYGTKSEKTSTLEIEGEMSLFNEIESSADPDAPEPDLVEVEKHLRKKKYAGQAA